MSGTSAVDSCRRAPGIARPRIVISDPFSYQMQVMVATKGLCCASLGSEY